MLYHDGKDVRVGDRASIDRELEGTVIITFDDGSALPNQSVEEWEKSIGVLILFENGSRLYIEKSDDVSHFFLISRHSSRS